jgi:hypothetical protein
VKRQYIWIGKLIDERSPVWVERMNLTDYEIEHSYLDSYFGDDGEEDFKISAVTECRPQYLEAKIKWFLPSCVRHDPKKLEETLVHELGHVLLAPEQGIIDEIRTSDIPSAEKIADLYSYQRENCTERLARVMWKAYPNG